MISWVRKGSTLRIGKATNLSNAPGMGYAVDEDRLAKTLIG
jgi:hypothetical protein